jgi:hypothetical protein
MRKTLSLLLSLTILTSLCFAAWELDTIKFDFPVYNMASTVDGIILQGKDTLYDYAVINDTIFNLKNKYVLISPFTGENLLGDYNFRFKLLNKIDTLLFYTGDFDGFGIWNLGTPDSNKFMFGIARGFSGSSVVCDGSLQLMTDDYLLSWCRVNGIEVSSTHEMWNKMEQPVSMFGDTLTILNSFNYDSKGIYSMALGNNKIYGVSPDTQGLLIFNFENDSISFNSIYNDPKILWAIDTIIDSVYYDTVIEFSLEAQSAYNIKVKENHLYLTTFLGVMVIELSSQGIPVNYSHIEISENLLCRILVDTADGWPVYDSYPSNIAVLNNNVYVSSYCDSAIFLLREDKARIKQLNLTKSGLIRLQNFPNPFKGVTKIRFNLPKPCRIKIEVFNTKGELIKLLAEGYHSNGAHEIKWNTGGLSSGVYYLRIKAPGICRTHKVLFIK